MHRSFMEKGVDHSWFISLGNYLTGLLECLIKLSYNMNKV